ncbi:MAG: 50S ribosomal protein L25/general stress protein Ctc [Actinomycetales bacterium]|nr:50S ribosomal protein L25/general stress protein Ctc [Actinomycetales bacterium]
MSDLKISAETRTEFGKGAARRLRREGKIPAVLYGHGSDPIHVALPGHASTMALKHANALLEITTGSETLLGIPRQIQRDPLRGDIEHVDLLIVKKGEKVSVEIPLTHTGSPAPGTLVVTVVTTIKLEVEATHIPEEVEVSLDGLEAGTSIHASDITLPKGATLADEGDLLLVNLTEAPSAADMEGDAEETAAEAAPAAEATEAG